MRRAQPLGAAGLLLGVLGVRAPARACEPIGQTAHTVIASMQATDQTPPVLPALPPADVHRSDGSGRGGCGQMVCPDVGIISIAALATDDMTAPAQIGYRFTLESGMLPAGFTLPPTAVVGTALWWGSDPGHGAIDFTLRVVAIDLAGNESAPQTVRVVDDTGGGCAIVWLRRSSAGPAVLAIAALLLAAPRRPRRLRRSS